MVAVNTANLSLDIPTDSGEALGKGCANADCAKNKAAPAMSKLGLKEICFFFNLTIMCVSKKMCLMTEVSPNQSPSETQMH
jgi:hypothetical protein